MTSTLTPQKHIEFLHNLVQHEQRSPAWFEQRKTKLTSSDAATSLGINPYQVPEDLLFKKCGAGAPFEGNVATLHGQKYEDEAILHYCKLMGKTNHDFGLLEFTALDETRGPTDMKFFTDKYPDMDISFLAGSTDGVAVDKHDMENLLVLEVKCPYRRKIINGYCPDYYLPQVQLNMFILNLDKADFIEYTPKKVAPKFLDEPELNIVRIHRDNNWFLENVPILHAFWKQVIEWRSKDIKDHPLYDKLAYKPPPKSEPEFVEDEHDQETLYSKLNHNMFRDPESTVSFAASFTPLKI